MGARQSKRQTAPLPKKETVVDPPLKVTLAPLIAREKLSFQHIQEQALILERDNQPKNLEGKPEKEKDDGKNGEDDFSSAELIKKATDLLAIIEKEKERERERERENLLQPTQERKRVVFAPEIVSVPKDESFGGAIEEKQIVEEKRSAILPIKFTNYNYVVTLLAALLYSKLELENREYTEYVKQKVEDNKRRHNELIHKVDGGNKTYLELQDRNQSWVDRLSKKKTANKSIQRQETFIPAPEPETVNAAQETAPEPAPETKPEPETVNAEPETAPETVNAEPETAPETVNAEPETAPETVNLAPAQEPETVIEVSDDLNEPETTLIPVSHMDIDSDDDFQATTLLSIPQVQEDDAESVVDDDTESIRSNMIRVEISQRRANKSKKNKIQYGNITELEEKLLIETNQPSSSSASSSSSSSSTSSSSIPSVKIEDIVEFVIKKENESTDLYKEYLEKMLHWNDGIWLSFSASVLKKIATRFEIKPKGSKNDLVKLITEKLKA